MKKNFIDKIICPHCNKKYSLEESINLIKDSLHLSFCLKKCAQCERIFSVNIQLRFKTETNSFEVRNHESKKTGFFN